MADKISKAFLLVFVFALAGAVIAAISLHQHVQLHECASAGPSFCNINATLNCDAVSLSEWSTLFGFPLAAYGFGFYLFLALIALAGLTRGVLGRGRLTDLLLVFSILATIFSAYLFYVSEFIIGTLCLLCIGMYAVNIILLLTALLAGRKRPLTSRLAAGVRATLDLMLLRVGEGRTVLHVTLWLLILLTAALTFRAPAIAREYVLKTCPKTDTDPQERKIRIREIVSQWEAQNAVSLPVNRDGALTRDYTKGAPGAPVQIVEFADFECPACRRFMGTLDQLVAAYPTKVEVIFRNYPLDMACNAGIPQPMHQHACFAAQYARCAGEQDKFWPIVTAIFQSDLLESDAESAVREGLQSEAQSQGLDVQAIDECMASGRQLQKIRDDIAAGDDLKIQGTPAIWINGKPIAAAHIDVLHELVQRVAGSNP